MSYLTPAQVAERWQCSPEHVQRLCARGLLRALRLGRLWRISEGAVLDYEIAHLSPEPREEVQPSYVTSVAGVSLPDDYVPVFGELWTR